MIPGSAQSIGPSQPYGKPMQSMGMGMPGPMMMPPQSQTAGFHQSSMQMPPSHVQSQYGAMQGQYLPHVARPQVAQVANPPVMANNVQYGPSYQMQHHKRSTADKTAVKYTGFLPLEGVYEEDTCRIG